MKGLEIFDFSTWESSPSEQIQKRAIQALEEGKIVFFPKLSFELNPHESKFLSTDNVCTKAKNISYDIKSGCVKGTTAEGESAQQLKEMMKRYSRQSRQLVKEFFPNYMPHIIQARTSFRPVQIAGRSSSYRKDDTRLHVDAFPATPVHGQRIMRVFTNVNPHNEPRVWRIGEPFLDVAHKMLPRAKKPIPGIARLLQLLKITKKYRSPYDHYMLQIHDAMKYDLEYQGNAPQEKILFPAGSTWIVYTDQVSHAAMSGQYVFEQTFQLPIHGMLNQKTSPLRTLENKLGRALI